MRGSPVHRHGVRRADSYYTFSLVQLLVDVPTFHSVPNRGNMADVERLPGVPVVYRPASLAELRVLARVVLASSLPFPLDLLTAAAQPVLIQRSRRTVRHSFCMSARRSGCALGAPSPGWSTASSQPGQVCAWFVGRLGVDSVDHTLGRTEPKSVRGCVTSPQLSATRRGGCAAARGYRRGDAGQPYSASYLVPNFKRCVP